VRCDGGRSSKKKANGFKDALPLLSAPDSLAELCTKLRQQSLGFLSFQDPKKIIAGYALIGKERIFEDVADIWQGPRTSADDQNETWLVMQNAETKLRMRGTATQRVGWMGLPSRWV
jgi:hypothetical protein